MTTFLCLLSLLFIQRAVAPVETGVPYTVRVDDFSSLPNGGALSVKFEVNGNSGTYCCRGAARPDARSSDPLRLQNLSSGANVVTVSKVPLGYFVKSLTFDGTDLLVSPLTLPAKTAGAQIEVVLTKSRPTGRPSGFNVSGRVTNLELPRPDIQLMLREVSPTGQVVYIGTAANELAVSANRKDGSFEIEGVPPGHYELSVVGSASQGLTFDVAGKNIENLDLRFETASRK